jgi:putative cell wall-binding protein
VGVAGLVVTVLLVPVQGAVATAVSPRLSGSAAGSSAADGWTRLAGADRYATATAVSRAAFPSGAPAAVVASGESFPDGLAASYLAGQVGGPVLLTASDRLSPATAVELVRLRVSTVYVVGGPAAVSAAVVDRLRTVRGEPDVTVVRVAGADRYATALAVATRGTGRVTSAAVRAPLAASGTALLASGETFADALAGSAAAAGAHLPLLLTRPNALPSGLLDALDRLGITKVVLLGGTQAVSVQVEQQLTAAGVRVLRIGGADRVQTATWLADWEVDTLGFDSASVAVARGDDAGGGADALGLGVLAGQGRHPLLLTASPGSLGAALLAWLTNDSALSGGTLAGGPSAISDSVLRKLEALTGGGGSSAADASGGGGGTTTPPPAGSPDVSVEAPDSVQTSSQFDLSFVVTAGDAVTGAVLELQAPTSGAQVTPPDDLAVDASDGTASVALGDLAAGSTRTVHLRWAAPATVGTLTFEVRLTGDGVDQADHADVQVVDQLPSSMLFTDDLVTLRSSQTMPYGTVLISRPCIAQIPATPVPAFADAKTAATALVAPGTATQAWEDLDLANHPERADDVALVAFTAQYPEAALAASLEGYRLDPSDSTSLSNAAAAATMLNHPEWAIAFETQVLAQGEGHSVGFHARAVSYTNIAHAHALMGQWGEALTAIQQAAAVEPTSPQVQQELANILYCNDDRPGANVALQASLRTHGDPPDDVVATSGGVTSSSRISASKLFDLSGATAPHLVLPSLPVSLAAIGPLRGFSGQFYDAEYHRVHDRQQYLFNRENELRTQLRGEDVSPATLQRTTDILSHLSQLGDASLTAPYEAMRLAHDDEWELNDCDGQFTDNPVCGLSGSRKACSDTNAIFHEWVTRLAAEEQAIRDYYDVAWPLFTGLQANLSDPVAFELAGDLIEDHFLAQVEEVVQNLWVTAPAFSFVDDDGSSCVGAEGPGPDPEVTTTSGGTPSPCSAGSYLSRMNVVIDLEFGSLKQTCEKTTFEVSTGHELGFLAGFAKMEVPNDGQSATFFVGSKASLGGASFESAFYLAVGRDNKVTDFGIDTGPEVEVSNGVPVLSMSVTPYSDHVRVSMMTVFQKAKTP